MKPLFSIPTAVVISCLLLFATENSVSAKTKTKKEKEPEPVEVAHLRFWRIGEPGALTVKLKDSEDELREIFNGEQGSHFESYQEVAPDSYEMKVAGEDDKKLVTLPVKLSAGSFTTILLRCLEDECAAEFIDDTLSTDAGVAVAIYPVEAILEPRIEIGEQAVFKLEKLDRRLRVEGLNPEKTVIKIQTGSEGVAPSATTIEVNLQSFKHISVILGKDRYGRSRPRVFIDGQLESIPKAVPAGEQK